MPLPLMRLWRPSMAWIEAPQSQHGVDGDHSPFKPAITPHVALRGSLSQEHAYQGRCKLTNFKVKRMMTSTASASLLRQG